jgi:hypothetical protein
MPDRQYTYQVRVDASSTQAAAKQVRDAFEREMARTTIGTQAAETAKQQTAIVRAQTQAQVAAVRAASAEAANASKASTSLIIEQERRKTDAERSGQQTRLVLLRGETAERQQLAMQRTSIMRTEGEKEVAQTRAQAAVSVEVERQKTASLKAQLAQQTAEHRAALAQRTADKRAQAAEDRRIEREKVAAARQAEREKVAATKQAEREKTEAARETAYIEAQEARQSAQEVRRLQKELSEAFKQEKKEQAAAAKQAARQEAEAARAAAQAQRQSMATGGGRTFGGALRGIDNFLALGVGGLAGYGAFQAGQAAYTAGREGAVQERTSIVLEQTARRLDVSSQALTNAILAGSRNTLTQAQAQQTALQLLSQSWAPQRTDIVGDAGLLAQAGRLFSQRYPTSEGQVQSPAEVQGRLLGYIREGNKELIDQFGFNNAMVAKAAGVPNENLTAEDRARGLFKILAEEVTRLGETSGTSIDKIENAEARFTDAMDRIRQALAAPVANAAQGGAFLADRFSVASGTASMSQVRGLLSTEANYQGPDVENWLSALKQYDAALAKNEASARGYEATLLRLGTAIGNNGRLNGVQASELANVQQRLDLIAQGQDAYSRAMSITTEEATKQNTEIYALVVAMTNYEDALLDGELTMPQYIAGLNALAERLGVVAEAAGLAAGAIDAVNVATADPTLLARQADALGGAAWNNYIATGQRPPGLAGPLPPMPADREGAVNNGLGWWGNAATGWASSNADDNNLERQKALDEQAKQDRQRADQEAAKNQRAWESAADKTAKAFEQAAEDAAGAFKDALGKVPGLFGTSSVTEQDMADAAAGIYQPKADEYLRQLRDEVLNNKDYPGVDLADIAGVAGVDQSLPRETQLRLIERKWDDSSLFANPDALRFINRDAIAAQQAQDAASAAGKQNLYAFLGLGPDTPLTPAQQAAYAQMTGLDTNTPTGEVAQRRRIITGANGQAMGLTIPGDAAALVPPEGELKDATATAKETVAAEIAKPDNTGASATAFLDELLAGLDPAQIAGETAKTLQALGTAIFGAVFTGYESAAAEAKWSEAVVQGLVDEVLPAVLAAIEEQP